MNEGELASIRRRLRKLYDADSIDAVLAAPQKLLGGRTPIEMIEGGETERVHAWIDSFLAGTYL